MRAAWRLSINGLAGRRSRSGLLIGAVALSTALVSAVACALASLNAGMQQRVDSSLGRADIRVREVAGGRFDGAVLDLIESQAEVELTSPRTKGAISLRNPSSSRTHSVAGEGVEPDSEARMVTASLDAGRPVEREGEIVLAGTAAEELDATVGTFLDVVRFGEPISLEVVGILPQENMMDLRKPRAIVTRAQLEAITMRRGSLSEIQVVLREGEDAVTVAERWGGLLPDGVMAQTTERVTSGAKTAIQANTFMFLLASVLAYIASAFIVLTGLTTNVLEKQREFGILRCIGSDRRTLAQSQLFVGAIIGGIGAAIGVPLGIAMALVITVVFPERLPAGLHTPVGGLSIAAAGSVIAGLLGALWPAVSAARVRPLTALTVRSVRPKTRGIVILTVLGVLGLAWQLIVVGLPGNPETVFFGYLTTGLPSMFIGYFLLGVPVGILVARVLGPVVALLVRVPREMLVSSAVATPYRNGFTAGALMVGLSIMTSIWTNGSALLNDWLDAIEFPDAFVHGWFGIEGDARERVESLEFVSATSAITLYKIETEAFGLDSVKNPPTNFVAFEPEPFFAMTKLHWVEGDPDYAKRRLDEGGAVLVAKEFVVKREGFGVGDTFRVSHDGQEHDFEIVGVVSSPGLDVVSFYFDISKEYASQAISSVFGTRADLQRVFQSDVIHLLQIGLEGEITDAEATDLIREAMRDATGGTAMVVGSGREIKEKILEVGYGSMRIATIIAIGAMLIGSLGVGNVVVAGIEARHFEFGVLRAVGAGAGLLGRLILGEVILISLTACVLGTGLGLQVSWAAIRMYELLAGLQLNLSPPLTPLALGWAMLIGLTVLVVSPLIIRIMRTRVRVLLSSTRG